MIKAKLQMQLGLAYFKNPTAFAVGFLLCLVLGGLDVPDLVGVLTNGTVRGELGARGDVQQALTAKGQTVGILTVCL